MNPPQTLTAAEVQALLAALGPAGKTRKHTSRRLRNYTIASLMLEAGLRVGEVTKLTWGHLYFGSLPVSTIIIDERVAEKGCCREIPVSSRLSEALKAYHPAHWSAHDERLPCFYTVRKGVTKKLTTRQVERDIRAASLRAFGRPIHPHMLRHTFATRLMKVTNSSVVQTLLGHKHLTSTQVYCHPGAEDLVKAISDIQAEP